jgi:hypothetical protein
MLDYLLVSSVSSWDSVTDWIRAWAKGLRAQIIRAGTVKNGAPVDDYQFRKHVAAARTAKAPIGLYWNLVPTYSPQAQAEFFAALIKSLELAVPIPWFVDVETLGSSPDQAGKALRDFCIVMDSLYRGLRQVIYTRQTFFDPNVAPVIPWGEKYDLYAARYPGTLQLTSPWSDGKYKFRDWQEWKIWQFMDNAIAVDYGFNPDEYNPNNLDPITGESRGYSEEAELSYFNGTETDLLAYFGNQYPQPEPEPEPMPDLETRVKVVENALRISLQAVALLLKNEDNILICLDALETAQKGTELRTAEFEAQFERHAARILELESRLAQAGKGYTE